MLVLCHIDAWEFITEELSTVPRLAGSELSAMSLWHAEMLARTTREAVWIGELVRHEVHIVHQAVRPHEVVQALGGAGALSWHACALGHAIVAGLDDSKQAELLAIPAQRLTGLTIVDADALRQMLATTRMRGYAVEAHAATLGDAGIAAPVADSSGQIIGAIGIVGPADRLLSDEWHESYARAVLSAAKVLSQHT
jgi:DNA-binding IclR family transcriptional regulator